MASSESTWNEGVANGALANAAAAAPVADEPSLQDADDAFGAFEELTVKLSRTADGSLGLSVCTSDEEGRPVVQAGRESVRAGDLIVAVDGTEMYTATQLARETQLIFATGVNDEVSLRLRRPKLIAQAIQWKTTKMVVSAGELLRIPLVASEAALGTFSFACDAGMLIDFTLVCSTTGAPDVDLVKRHGAASAGGEFLVPCAGIVYAQLDNSSSHLASVALAVTVRLTPISQALQVEVASAQAALSAQSAHLEMCARPACRHTCMQHA